MVVIFCGQCLRLEVVVIFCAQCLRLEVVGVQNAPIDPPDSPQCTSTPVKSEKNVSNQQINLQQL